MLFSVRARPTHSVQMRGWLPYSVGQRCMSVSQTTPLKLAPALRVSQSPRSEAMKKSASGSLGEEATGKIANEPSHLDALPHCAA